MPGDGHVRFGERPGETDRQQCRHRAPGRLNHLIRNGLLRRYLPTQLHEHAAAVEYGDVARHVRGSVRQS